MGLPFQSLITAMRMPVSATMIVMSQAKRDSMHLLVSSMRLLVSSMRWLSDRLVSTICRLVSTICWRRSLLSSRR